MCFVRFSHSLLLSDFLWQKTFPEKSLQVFPGGGTRQVNKICVSRILMGIHFGDSFMHGLCSWMVDGERKRSVSVSSQQEQFGIDHCLLNGLTVLSRILVDY